MIRINICDLPKCLDALRQRPRSHHEENYEVLVLKVL